MSRKYVIIDADEVSSVDFSQVFETSADTLRYNIDPARTKTFVKFEGATPDFLEGKTQYTHSQILTILATEEWTDPNPPE
tara:strand:- start:1471 stop:1710 length:240 start_codon:yes stop_codon:yes gene_type:complete